MQLIHLRKPMRHLTEKVYLMENRQLALEALLFLALLP